MVGAGPFVKVVVGTPGALATLDIAGQSVSGVFAFEQLTKPTGERLVTVAVSDAGLNLGETIGVELLARHAPIRIEIDQHGDPAIGRFGLRGVERGVRLSRLFASATGQRRRGEQ